MEAEIKEIESDNYVQIKKNKDILKLKIRDENGNDTGKMLTFNLEDIELPLRLQEMIEEDKKNRAKLRNEFTIIDRKEDHKGKKIFSANEESKIKAMQDFYKKEIQIYNMFLGERGVEKLLNGRALSWSTLEEIDEIIKNTIMPKLKINADNIKKKIIEKYSLKVQDGDVIE